MSTTMTKVRGTLLAASAAATLMFAASAAEAKCTSTVDDDGEVSQFCTHGTFGMTPQQARAADNDDDDDDEVDADDDDDDDDDDAARGFTYDEDQGSLLVDLDDCAPGKFWMMETDEADDVMLPCR